MEWATVQKQWLNQQTRELEGEPVTMRVLVLDEFDCSRLQAFLESQGYWGHEQEHDLFAHELYTTLRRR